MIFVSVGTERFPFDRLIRAADRVAEASNGEPVFVQAGHCLRGPQGCQWVRFLPYQELVGQIALARIVVSHAGAGILLLCARAGKVPMVVARRKQFGEHVDDHQIELARRMAALGHAIVVDEPEALMSMITQPSQHHNAGPAEREQPKQGEPSLATSLSKWIAGDNR